MLQRKERQMDFWQVHGVWFLISIILFPRWTMLFAVPVPFGWLAWLSWFFVPSVLAAVLATGYYWETNPILCVLAWIFVPVKAVLSYMFRGFGSNVVEAWKAARQPVQQEV